MTFPTVSPGVPFKLPRDYQLADWYHERIYIQLKQFRARLSADETYTTQVILNNGQTIYPNSIGYHNPNMLVVDGWDVDNNEVVLLVPPSSAQILFTRHKKSELTERQRQPLGFHMRSSSPGTDPSADQSTSTSLLEE